MGRNTIMVQGTGSNVGKSLIVAGLCRYFSNLGMAVRPFKPQNMSNNAAVTLEGGEIGRAQDLQALACRVQSSIDMNPVLLKPETDKGAQVIVQGEVFGTMHASEYGQMKSQLLPKVLESFHSLQDEADLIVIEGAGSPAEVNLREGDIANMGFAEVADVPVVLVGDIDKGGVIANMVGTHMLLEESERKRIKAFLINRFRGDISLFQDGISEIQQRTGWLSAGTLPWFDQAIKLPAEDIVSLVDGKSSKPDAIKIAVPVFSRMANFDDLDPLRLEENVDLVLVQPGEVIPSDSHLVLLLGTKSTMGDLEFFRAQGWETDLAAHVRRRGKVLGICGGYQMLGKEVRDPKGIEGKAGRVPGLGHLDVKTELLPEKTVTKCTGQHIETNTRVSGYEIHLGESEGPDCSRPFLNIQGKMDGAISKSGTVSGTYLHGLFSTDEFRYSFLKQFGCSSNLNFELQVEQTLDNLAEFMKVNLKIETLQEIAMGRI